MLVCHVTMLPKGRTISAQLAEAAVAGDVSTLGNVIFATLIDDPANVRDSVDAFLGQIMREAASAADALAVGLAYTAAIVSPAAATDVPDATVAAAAATTWSPTDKTANIALSGGNLTAHATTSADGALRSSAGRSGLKFYFEVTYASPAGADTGCGIALSTSDLVTISTTGTGAFNVYNSGIVYLNGSNPSGISVGAFVNGDVLSFAIDQVNNRGWIRRNNASWNGNPANNPSTNTGGIDISSVFAGHPAYACASFNSTSPTATINFGGSTFAQSVPSGFVAFG